MSGFNYTQEILAKRKNLAFSTNANLLAAATFNSNIIYLGAHTQVQTNLSASHDGTVTIYWYSDSQGNDTVRTITFPYSAADGFQLYSAPIFSNYVKYSYTNGGTNQTDFLYETWLLKSALQPQLLTVQGQVVDSMVSQLSRSVLLAKKPDSSYQNINADYNGDLKVSIGANNRSAFGELNVSQVQPIVQEMFTYNINTRLFTTSSTGSGTLTQGNAMGVISTGTTSGSIAILETRKRARYRPGIGFLNRFTALFTTPTDASQAHYAGLLDEEDGFAFGYNGTDFGILRRSKASGAVVDTWVTQANWNRDPADGTMTLPNVDWTKGNVFEIQAQYLGFGDVNFYVENTSGEFILVHTIEYAGANTQPTLANPSLPMCYYAKNGTTTTDIILKSASCGIFIEGVEKPHGSLNSIDNSKASIGSTETNILTIKDRTSYNSLTNHNLVYPYFLSVATISGTKPTTIKLTLNTTLGGSPSYTNIDTNNSIVEYDTAGTTLTGGNIIATFVLGKEDRIEINLKELEEVFLSPGDTLTVSAATPSGTVEVFASILWLEDL